MPGLVDPDQFVEAIKQAGYQAEPVTRDEEQTDRGAVSRESEVADITQRFNLALALTIPVLIGAMWHLVLPMPGGLLGSFVGFWPTRSSNSS